MKVKEDSSPFCCEETRCFESELKTTLPDVSRALNTKTIVKPVGRENVNCGWLVVFVKLTVISIGWDAGALLGEGETEGEVEGEEEGEGELVGEGDAEGELDGD